jgi:hypothetical protein
MDDNKSGGGNPKDQAPGQGRRLHQDRPGVGERQSRRGRRGYGYGYGYGPGIWSGLFEATLESVAGIADAFQVAADGMVSRTREDRRRGGRRSGYRYGSFADNMTDTSYDVMDVVANIPARAWDAYRDEIEAPRKP